MWFDGAHHSDKANGQLAELMWNGGPDIVSPYTIKDLFDLEILPATTTTTKIWVRQRHTFLISKDLVLVD